MLYFFEKPPLFTHCEEIALQSQQKCFDETVFHLVFENFKVPQKVVDDKYIGETVVLFEVDTLGHFKVIYVDAMYDELKTESKRVFAQFPKIKPGTYNGKPTYKQYSIKIEIPLVEYVVNTSDLKKQNEISKIELAAKLEIDSVNNAIVPFEEKTFSSQLNIPFTHFDYSKFDRNMKLVGANSHTASKPFLYEEVSTYYDFKAENEKVQKTTTTWAARKLWNEHLVQLQGKDYWFTIDPIFDLEVGKDSEADFSTTYKNTRGLLVKGGIGKKFNFYTSFFESQGRFAQYVNDYAESLKAFGPDPAIIPGRGIGKQFKTDSYDYPVAEAYLSYTPAKFINIQFGHGKNFIGDGYRSLLVSDVASPHTFLKFNTKFWKIKYTNTWMWLKDVRPETIDENGAYLSKYMATHYLSWNATKRLNIGFYESVSWLKADKGFDWQYMNPIIFMRPVEWQNGSADNVLLGANVKFKVNNNVSIYGQAVLDDLKFSELKKADGYWGNKYGGQIGVKAYNLFKVYGLSAQAEYNVVRPFTYTHFDSANAHTHMNEPLAHPLGANFQEAIGIVRYKYKRHKFTLKVVWSEIGRDTSNVNHGGNVFYSYNTNRVDINGDEGLTGYGIAQGDLNKLNYLDARYGFMVNPRARLYFEIGLKDRSLSKHYGNDSQNRFIYLGLRTTLNNTYNDHF